MRTLQVLVPKPGTDAARVIRPGSGVVSAGDGGVHVLVHYEGALYGFASYKDKVLRAAGRLAQDYPTIAKGVFPAEDFVQVGTFTYSMDWREYELLLDDEQTVEEWTKP